MAQVATAGTVQGINWAMVASQETRLPPWAL